MTSYRITGRVRDEQNRPAKDYVVQAFDKDQGIYLHPDDRLGKANTADDGSFEKNRIRERAERLQINPEVRLQNTIGLIEKKACASVQPAEILVFGHTHRPFVNRLENVVNSGSWVTDAAIQVLSSLRLLDSSASTEGLPSVSDSHTIASTADATAANLTALAQHSLGQLDHVASQGFTLGPSNHIPNIAPLSSFGPKAHIPLLRSVHQLTTKNTERLECVIKINT